MLLYISLEQVLFLPAVGISVQSSSWCRSCPPCSGVCGELGGLARLPALLAGGAGQPTMGGLDHEAEGIARALPQLSTLPGHTDSWIGAARVLLRDP